MKHNKLDLNNISTYTIALIEKRRYTFPDTHTQSQPNERTNLQLHRYLCAHIKRGLCTGLGVSTTPPILKKLCVCVDKSMQNDFIFKEKHYDYFVALWLYSDDDDESGDCGIWILPIVDTVAQQKMGKKWWSGAARRKARREQDHRKTETHKNISTMSAFIFFIPHICILTWRTSNTPLTETCCEAGGQ